MLPNKWGQGQLFAFSALDGESLFTDDLREPYAVIKSALYSIHFAEELFTSEI